MADKVMSPTKIKVKGGVNHTGTMGKIKGPVKTQLQPFNNKGK